LVAYSYNPTCNIDGIVSGYTGPGSKTINPAHASVKLDFRLVPGQRPLRILAALRAHLRRKGFGDIQVIQHSIFEPGASPFSSPIGQALMAAYQDVYGAAARRFPVGRRLVVDVVLHEPRHAGRAPARRRLQREPHPRTQRAHTAR
jgi:acetylornithine deacetylase/succinyl-diaminopimelate desuccinylase-like protein